jgi:hypothetical protein
MLTDSRMPNARKPSGGQPELPPETSGTLRLSVHIPEDWDAMAEYMSILADRRPDYGALCLWGIQINEVFRRQALSLVTLKELLEEVVPEDEASRTRLRHAINIVVESDHFPYGSVRRKGGQS